MSPPPPYSSGKPMPVWPVAGHLDHDVPDPLAERRRCRGLGLVEQDLRRARRGWSRTRSRTSAYRPSSSARHRGDVDLGLPVARSSAWTPSSSTRAGAVSGRGVGISSAMGGTWSVAMSPTVAIAGRFTAMNVSDATPQGETLGVDALQLRRRGRAEGRHVDAGGDAEPAPARVPGRPTRSATTSTTRPSTGRPRTTTATTPRRVGRRSTGCVGDATPDLPLLAARAGADARLQAGHAARSRCSATRSSGCSPTG